MSAALNSIIVLTLHASQNVQNSGNDEKDQRVAQISAGNLQPDYGSTILWDRNLEKYSFMFCKVLLQHHVTKEVKDVKKKKKKKLLFYSKRFNMCKT